MRVSILILLALTLLASASVALADTRQTGDQKLDPKLKGMLESSFLTTACPVPDIQPKVCNLKRSMSPNGEQLRRLFLGDSTEGIEDIAVTSPLWGRGRRHQASYETSFKLKVGPEDNPQLQTEGGMASGTVIPVTLDLYNCGFIYSNNLPHLPVRGAEIKENGGAKAEFSRSLVFSESEGQRLAETEIATRVGKLSVPDGFRQINQSTVQDFGQRLFVYRTFPEFLTTYTVYKNDKDGKIVAAGTQKVAIPVLDCFIHVQLDGDKTLAGMEYFWDGNLKPQGETKESINAAHALMKGREWLFRKYNGAPPLLTINRIRLGFVQDRGDWTRLIPAWIFDASYSATVSDQNTNSASLSAVNTPFAVNALTGDAFGL